jgi:murein DD-endopeptidase MepM/ murein hydrolase activator NlpD
MAEDASDNANEGDRSDQPERASTWQRLRELDLRVFVRRYGRHMVILLVVALGVWAARIGLDSIDLASPATPTEAESQVAATATNVPSSLTVADLPPYRPGQSISYGVHRLLDIHTVIPSRPRLKVIQYEVKQGDSLFGIADQFGLKPETILWGNYETLKDNVHALSPGQELNILPVDGTYYQWHEGDTLTGVADFFGVEPEDILDWPGNELDPSMDYENPDIEPGTWLVVPGGTREIVSWQAPRVTRQNPAAARVIGPGYCGQVIEGAIGTGTFVWPTPGHTISGYNFSSLHPAIDIGGSIGNGIYASDQGVVVYAGWNNYGYGNLIILDHGNGWQSLYAHLNSIGVTCGQSVFQGTQIGAMGCTGNCTGPHLHFELQSDLYGKVNPLNFLP